jgi:hypothetical protein
LQQKHKLAKYEHELLVLYRKHFQNCYFVKLGANAVLYLFC